MEIVEFKSLKPLGQRDSWFQVKFKVIGHINGNSSQIAKAAITFFVGDQACGTSSETSDYAVRPRGMLESEIRIYDVFEVVDDETVAYMASALLRPARKLRLLGSMFNPEQNEASPLAHAVIFDKNVTPLPELSEIF